MIYTIATTTLNKEVKRKLETNQYSKEEATAIYMEYLKVKEQREKSFRTVRLIMMFTVILLPIFTLVGALQRGQELVPVLFSILLLLFIIVPVYFLAYYLMFSRFKHQLHSTMSTHYADVIEEFENQ
ncbi:hypothetical protein [Streptococcus oralis]|uniref:hypothetical protein n=1 Tax=Streptococcus oralis TaxID=1303 RepID=UPI001F42DE7F|nr:hypothetical protein [Streptococcus oralis]UJD01619.1 hypothetical protein GOM47_02435 [Streptococcus oralis]